MNSDEATTSNETADTDSSFESVSITVPPNDIAQRVGKRGLNDAFYWSLVPIPLFFFSRIVAIGAVVAAFVALTRNLRWLQSTESLTEAQRSRWKTRLQLGIAICKAVSVLIILDFLLGGRISGFVHFL